MLSLAIAQAGSRLARCKEHIVSAFTAVVVQHDEY